MPVKKSGFLSDFRSFEDGLNFDIFKPALLNVLEGAETPLTVGIFGTWGSGKTTLLNMLKDELDAKQLSSLKTVWFTAWKYEQNEALWRAFMLRVIDGLHPRKVDGTRYQPEEFNTPAEHEKREAILMLGRLERSIYETVNWQDESQWSINFGELLKQGGKLPIWLAFHLAGVGSAAKELGLNPDLATLIEREVREHHLNQLTYMEQFAAEFQKTVQLLLGKDGRLVVFVDDLDRCLPEKALEVLEAIKLFLDVPGTVFVLGMDREIIRRGIETHYGAMLKTDGDEEIPINGDIYLQKLIQIPFNLPPLDMKGRVDFIQMLEKTLPSDYQLDSTTRQVFGCGLYPNPRQIKRALNVFYLLKQVALEQERRGLLPKNILSLPLLAKTVLIQSQWPELYKLWRQYPTLIQSLEDEYNRQPISEEEILLGKISDVPTSADPEKILEKPRLAPLRSPTTGLMAPFLNERQKYFLLAEMLRYSEYTKDGQKNAQFCGLKRAEVQIYIGLVGTFEQNLVENTLPAGLLPEDWLREMGSGDPAKLREILAAVNEHEPDLNGPHHISFRNSLVTSSQNPELPGPARVVAADLADELGYVPEDLHVFVPIRMPDNSQFYISRYPVTNLQYNRFLEAPDFANRDLWSGFPLFDEKGNTLQVKLDDSWNWLQKALGNQKPGTDGEKAQNPHRTHLLQPQEAIPASASYTGSLLPRSWRDRSFGIFRKCVPVVGISWHEANAYCAWLLRHWKDLKEKSANLHLLPRTLRLPTEAEWIFVAGGAEPAERFPWDKDIITYDDREITKRANFDTTHIGRTTPVKLFPLGASPFGVWDLSGNVWEWTSTAKDPEANSIIMHGGSWYDIKEQIRPSFQGASDPNQSYASVGFRVALFISE